MNNFNVNAFLDAIKTAQQDDEEKADKAARKSGDQVVSDAPTKDAPAQPESQLPFSLSEEDVSEVIWQAGAALQSFDAVSAALDTWWSGHIQNLLAAESGEQLLEAFETMSASDTSSISQYVNPESELIIEVIEVQTKAKANHLIGVLRPMLTALKALTSSELNQIRIKWISDIQNLMAIALSEIEALFASEIAAGKPLKSLRDLGPIALEIDFSRAPTSNARTLLSVLTLCLRRESMLIEEGSVSDNNNLLVSSRLADLTVDTLLRLPNGADDE